MSFITNALGGLVSGLSGANYNANRAGNYYGNAANNAGSYYNDALNKIVNSTGTGSPAATTFGNEEMAALQPLFDRQQQQLGAREAAMGIGSSGAGKADFANLGNDQSATLAGLIAPLYQQALGAYTGGALQGAGTQSGIVGQGAGAQANAYGQSLNDFYGALGAAGAGGAFGGGAGSANPYETTLQGDNGIYNPGASVSYGG